MIQIECTLNRKRGVVAGIGQAFFRTFEQAVAAYRANGLMPEAAVRKAFNAFPDLHRAYLMRLRSCRIEGLFHERS